MKITLHEILNQLEDLKKSFDNGKSLKNYCELRNISYTSTSRLLNKPLENMYLITAYNILGLTPERNILQDVLSMRITDLLKVRLVFLDGNL